MIKKRFCGSEEGAYESKFPSEGSTYQSRDLEGRGDVADLLIWTEVVEEEAVTGAAGDQCKEASDAGAEHAEDTLKHNSVGGEGEQEGRGGGVSIASQPPPILGLKLSC